MLNSVMSWLKHSYYSRYSDQAQRWLHSSRSDRHSFSKTQIEYFLYLHHMLSALKGSRTLREVFVIDAGRYGLKHWRGRLASCWSQRYEHSGGDLYATWFDCCDAETLALLRSAQTQGEQALIETFKQVSELLSTKRQIRRALIQMAGPGVLAALILTSMLAVVPLYTVPQLFTTFGDLPDAYLGPYSVALRGFSEILSRFSLIVLGILGVSLWLLRMSLSRFIGPLRNRIELMQPWHSYRLFQSFKIFSLLSVLLKAQTSAQNFGVCLDAIDADRNAWLSWRLNVVRQRLRDGASPYKAFDQGFLRATDAWYFSDITSAQGLEQGLYATALYLHQQLLAVFHRYAQLLKWGLLIGSVGGLISLGLWHFLAIEELRSGLLLFYSS